MTAELESARVGSRAPDFSLDCTRVAGQERGRAALEDYRDRWLILIFYPCDFSLVCPTELTAPARDWTNLLAAIAIFWR